MRSTVFKLIAAAAIIAPTMAQDRKPDLDRVQAAAREVQALERARMGVESRIVKGAPYSGEAVTESTQVLADGNRIVRKNVARVFRDSEGRTRREQMNANGADVDIINISDPVAQATYVVDPQTHVAHHNGVIMATPRGSVAASVTPGSAGVITTGKTEDGAVTIAASEAGLEKREAEIRARTGGGGASVAAGGLARGGALPAKTPFPSDGNTTREDLGVQTIEGVPATGTRTTTVIPAGTIGNEQPIRIVSEQWLSEDLKVLVMTKYSDPRSGETIYRLTNIVRTDQPRSLFEVPPDYVVKESFIRRENR